MDFGAARRAMIDNQLRPEGVTDAAVLAAMGSVAREDHVPDAARAFAYFDRPILFGEGRAMMPPAALGRLLNELAPRPGERALVVGAASDYSAALLVAIGLDVDLDRPYRRRATPARGSTSSWSTARSSRSRRRWSTGWPRAAGSAPRCASRDSAVW